MRCPQSLALGFPKKGRPPLSEEFHKNGGAGLQARRIGGNLDVAVGLAHASDSPGSLKDRVGFTSDYGDRQNLESAQAAQHRPGQGELEASARCVQSMGVADDAHPHERSHHSTALV